VKGFTLSATPSFQTIEAGSSATYLLTLTVAGSFTPTVNLNAGSPPPDLQLNLSTTSLNPPNQATFILTDTHASGPLIPGVWHNIPVVATGGGFTRTVIVNLLVGGTRTHLPLILK
jgi:hypothetical protein